MRAVAEISSPLVKAKLPVSQAELQLSIRQKPVIVGCPTRSTSDRTKMVGKGARGGSRDAQSLAEVVRRGLVLPSFFAIIRQEAGMLTRHERELPYLMFSLEQVKITTVRPGP